MQSIAEGCDASVLLEALLIQEASERAKGDPERALMIFDMEMEMIQQDQTRDAIEELINIVREAAAEALAAGPDYRTGADDAECN